MSKSTVPDHAGAWSVPGYVEQRELSHGTFERVVEAVQEGTGRRVAIKYLGPDLVRTPDFLSRFRNQVLKLIELDVPSVVRVYDYAAQPGHGAAVVMELVNGVSLSDMIERQGPLDPEAALTVLKGTLLGLAAVHRLGFGHRDIKPGNVLVDNGGQVKLTNFGVAAPAAGTPGYLAPERWEGDPGSPASELYAATAAFFECLTGAPPFTGDLARLQEQHESGALPLDRVDAQLAPLIERGMAKDWASRPDSANGFVSELEAVAASAYGPDWEERGRGLLAARAASVRSRGGRQNPPGGSPAAVGGGRRSRLEVIVAIAAAVIVVAAIATAVMLSGGGHNASLSGSLSAGTPGLPTYSAVANVTPPVAASKCTAPTAFTYSATISSTAIGTVKYQWVYSSGALGPVRVASFTEAGNHVVTGKTVKIKRAGRGWAELELLGPAPKTSDKATYKLLCGASRGGITARAAVQPAIRTASCKPAPPSFTADGSITAAKAETVSYYWAQSDGEDSAPVTLTFAKPGTLAAEPLTIIPQPASGSGEVVLVVTRPVVAASAPATYTLSCTVPKTPTGHTGPIASTELSATASVSPASESLTSCSAPAPTFTFSGMITDSKAGTVGYHWRLPSGSGPARTLRFSHAGTQTVTTAYTPGSDTARGSGTLVITSPGAASSNPAAFTLSCGQGLGITNDAPTIAQVGQGYSGTVTVSGGGTGPYTWSVTGLPSGLTASGDGSTLTISGDPRAAGTFTPQISVHDSGKPELRGTTTFTLTVDSAAESPLVISGFLAGAVVNQGYSDTVIATGGDGAYSWAVTGLPGGLTATPSGGTLTVSGTPTASGSFPVDITVSDTESPAKTAAADLTLVVASPVANPTPSDSSPGTTPPTSSSPSPSPSVTPTTPTPTPTPSPSSTPTPTPTPTVTPSTSTSASDGGTGDGSGGGPSVTISLPPGLVIKLLSGRSPAS
jgi:eukaryotic-like serine/threonine-protein kinase